MEFLLGGGSSDSIVSMQLLDGKKAREHYIPLLQKRIKDISFTPQLAIIQVSDRSDSNIYIKNKKNLALNLGIKIIHIKLDEKILENEVLDLIQKYNNDKTIQGIIVQLPLPLHLNSENIINSISPEKDIDGLTLNTKFMPATARGIKELFDFYNIKLNKKKITIIGRSKLVGKPIAQMCKKEGAIVAVCHSKTENITEKTRDANILIVAIGKPKFIDEKYVKSDQIVIDVGITRDIEEGLVGDVDFENVKNIVRMITPVPGGVGQMTVLALFENLIDACYNLKI
ncbi:MAG: bifunctional 5,10-methylenetetrahydrofolate dehydrogenase/5,10-methenyltetrahydrofolate cyclohydrolase [Patescibacteria group bacterium]